MERLVAYHMAHSSEPEFIAGVLKEQISLRSQLEAAHQRIAELEAELEAARQRDAASKAELEAARQRNAASKAELEAARQRSAELEALVVNMRAEQASAKERQALGKSHVPTSKQDIAEKAARQAKNRKKASEKNSLREFARRQEPEKEPGGQPGHTGHGFKLPVKPDITEEVPHYPAECLRCSHWEECRQKMESCGTRHEVDVVIQTIHRQHKVMKRQCPVTGKTVCGQFPADITGSRQYGPTLKALVGHLFFEGGMSHEKVSLILAGLGIPMSTGTVYSIVRYLASQPSLIATVEQIRMALLIVYVLCSDETGLAVENLTLWVHIYATPDYTYYCLSDKRGLAGIELAGVLPGFAGIVVHDCWKPYWSPDLHLDPSQHALCNAHIIRELVRAHDVFPDEAWILSLAGLLYRVGKLCMKGKLRKQAKLPAFMQRRIRARYTALVEEGKALHPRQERQQKGRGRVAQPKVVNLLARLDTLMDAVLRCMSDLKVPFTNNLAEQAAKAIKVREKTSGRFATREGAERFLEMKSYLQTAKKKNMTTFEAIKLCLQDQCTKILTER